MKRTRRWNKALAAFGRKHPYPYITGLVTHERWVVGWMNGFEAGRRHQKRLTQGKSGESRG